jgi:hypothetical protein
MTAVPDSERVELPDPLRSAVVRDLRAVRPLRGPGARVLWLLPIAGILLIGSVLAFGLRIDSPRLGLMLTWGLSIGQMAASLVLMRAALQEAVPGTTLSRRAIGLAFGTGMSAVVTITWITWLASPTTIPLRAVAYVWRICFGATILTALPALILAGLLVARAFPLRPRLAGALYGLAAGLMADAGWRLFCHYSDPAHVFGAHSLAVAVTTLLGVALSARLSPR